MIKELFRLSFPLLFTLTIVSIGYIINKYRKSQKDKILKRILEMYNSNQEFRNIFNSFENEQREVKKNYLKYQEDEPFYSKGIVDNYIEICNIQTYVFYKYKAEEFEEEILNNIKKDKI